MPRELEGTLVLIGVIGVQLASHSERAATKVLPFYGPRRLIEAGLVDHGALLFPGLVTAAYGIGLLLIARILISRQVFVRKPGPIESPGVQATR